MCDNPEATPARKPAFIVTIDAEPDNLWAAQPPGTIRNAAFLPRFQELCERHGIRPVYLADYDMASDALFVEFGRNVMRRATGEIGMHLHAWMTPPFDPSTPDSCGAQPYLIEYPDSAMRAKIRTMTALLEAAFGCCPVSHRAGRWAFDGRYARMLADEGYLADCSVTPHMDWRMYPGVPGGAGGTDFSACPEEPYWMNADDVCRAGRLPILEVPMTVVRPTYPVVDILRRRLRRGSFVRRALNRLWPEVRWMRPNGRNRASLVDILRGAAMGMRHVEFMLHSSELMPGGSPYFPTEESIEVLYADMDAVFAEAARLCIPMTLAEFAAQWIREDGRP